MSKDITNKTLTVFSVDETEKSIKVKFKDDPDSDLIWAYASKRDGFTSSDFTEGDERLATLNWVPDKNDASKGFYGVKQWGSKQPANNSRQGGGGGFKSQPKSPGDIATMLACNINTSAIAGANHLATLGKVKDITDYCEVLSAINKALMLETMGNVGELKEVVA